MRGMPNNPVACTKCGSEWGFPKDGLCVRCRTLKLRKYIWTPELDNTLCRIYAEHARSRSELGQALRAFRTRLGWPVNALTARAMALRITRFEKHPWTTEEEGIVRSLAGVKSVTYISKKLRRSRSSVINRLWRMRVSSTCTDGYSISDLESLFGTGSQVITRWIKHGWLRRSNDTGRVSDKNIRKFLRDHAEQYDLKRVDQAWFKGMIFPSFGKFAHGMGENVSRNPYMEVA